MSDVVAVRDVSLQDRGVLSIGMLASTRVR